METQGSPCLEKEEVKIRIRTGYSFKTATGHLTEVVKRCKAIGWAHAPISDYCSTYAWAQWAKATEAEGLKPIYGVELAVTTNTAVKNPPLDYWTFFAIDDVRIIYKLIAQATGRVASGTPCLTYAEALTAKGCIKITGERTMLTHCKPQKNLFVGLSPGMPGALYKEAKAKGYAFIATSANSYTNLEDKEFYRVALGARAGVQTYPQHILTDSEWRVACWFAETAVLTKALAARNRAMAMCKATLPKATLLQPAKPKSLRAMCVAGAARLKIDLRNNVYAARLDHELKMIADKQFEDYFYIVAELVMWAKERMIVGPARGSSCGSLVCYLLGITAIDPIPFGLLFERFIDVTRSDLPDIDVDFSDQHRDEVFQHAQELYGADRVARLGTTSHFKARSALKQAAKALRIPDFKIAAVLDSMIERTSGDARANEALADTFTTMEAGRKLLAEFPALTIATRMEGHPTNAGQHAAGLVLTHGAVADYVAIDKRTGSVMCDKRDVDTFGLLKIDALGLTQLSIFERTLELIGKPAKAGWLEQLPLDDKAAFKVLNDQHFAGIFQFNGIAVQTMAKQVHITSLNDIVAMTALGRPGPMGSGGASKWAMRRKGNAKIEYSHPLMEPVLKETLGIMIFQEQIMQVGRQVGDLSWADVTALRKAMSKSMGQDYFDGFGNKWKPAAIRKGMPQEVADQVWREMCTFGNWSFNKSHAVAYGLVSYWCCWLKAHYPVAFAAATLDAEADPNRQITLLRELKEEGIDYVAVDKDHSTDRWQPLGDKRLVGPLTAIKGIGPAKVKEIIQCRVARRQLPESLAKLLQEGKTDIGSLYPIDDAIKTLYPDLTKLMHQRSIDIWKPIRKVQVNGHKWPVVIIGVINKIAPKDLNEALNVAKRGGGLIDGPHMELNMFFKDDTDQIFAKIDRDDYERIAPEIINRGSTGKAIYAIKGTVPKGFRMVQVQQYKFVGMLEDINVRPETRSSDHVSVDP